MKYTVKLMTIFTGLSLVTNILFFLKSRNSFAEDYIRAKGIIITDEKDREIISIGNSLASSYQRGHDSSSHKTNAELTNGISFYDLKGRRSLFLGFQSNTEKHIQSGIYLLDEKQNVRSEYKLEQKENRIRYAIAFDEYIGTESLVIGKDLSGNCGVMSTNKEKTLFLGTRRLDKRDHPDSISSFGYYEFSDK